MSDTCYVGQIAQGVRRTTERHILHYLGRFGLHADLVCRYTSMHGNVIYLGQAPPPCVPFLSTTAQHGLPVMRHTGRQEAEFDAQLVQLPQRLSSVIPAGIPVATLAVGYPVGRLLINGLAASRRVTLGQEPGVGRLAHLLDGQVERTGRFFL